MSHCIGFAAPSADAPLSRYEFERREPGSDDVELEVLYCGVCHSDLHQVRNDWHHTAYPCVPGHEMVGRITRVGDAVKGFIVGQNVAVGDIINSCRACAPCNASEENYCEQGFTHAVSSPDVVLGGHTHGGYSTHIVVDHRYVLTLADGIDLAGSAPLLCAGVTVWSPLRHWNVRSGSSVGVVGLGGLGHLAVRIASAMGAQVTVFTSSDHKKEDALRLGASAVVVTKNPEEMTGIANTLDLVIDTSAGNSDVNALLGTLRHDGTLVQVGAAPEPLPVSAFSLVAKRRSVAGSFIGSIAETQEMLDFCAEKGIVADIELIAIEEINEAYRRLEKGDVKYRFVIDGASLRENATGRE